MQVSAKYSTSVKTDDVDFCCIKALILGQLQLQYSTVLHLHLGNHMSSNSICKQHALISLSHTAACAPSVALSYEESDFAIRQTRFQDFEDGLNQCLFQVWGVASVLLGGDNNNQYYWFDCFHDSLSMGSTWVRIDPEGSVDSTALTGGARISFTSQTSNYLGLYACRASDGSMEYLNITDGRYRFIMLYRSFAKCLSRIL